MVIGTTAFLTCGYAAVIVPVDRWKRDARKITLPDLD